MPRRELRSEHETDDRSDGADLTGRIEFKSDDALERAGGSRPGALPRGHDAARSGRPRRPREDADAPVAPSQGGMGLGFFIARTLLERSGGKVSVGSGGGEKGQPKGARVTVRWPRQALEVTDPALEPRAAGGT